MMLGAGTSRNGNSSRRIPVADPRRIQVAAPSNRKRVRFSSPEDSSDTDSDVIIDEVSNNSSEESVYSPSRPYSPSSPMYSPPSYRRHRTPSPPLRNYRGRSADRYFDPHASPRYEGFRSPSSPCFRHRARSVSPVSSISPSRNWSDSDEGETSFSKRAHGSKHKNTWINDIDELSSQFENLYNCKDLSDVTLIVEGRRFPAHKVVLAARSSYFRGMFFCGLREAVEQEAVLHEVSADNFEIILRYIYTGLIELEDPTTNQAIMLTRLAHMYDLESLQKRLVRKLESIRITVKNFNELFSCGVLLSLNYIKDKCKTYALSKLDTLCKSNEFCELSVVHLEELFLPRDWSKSKDKTIANGLIRYIEKNPSSEEKVVALMKKIKLRLVKDGSAEWVVCRDIYRVPAEKRRRIDNDNAQ